MANPGVQDNIRYIPATITSGTSLSAAVALDGLNLIGIQMPAGWDAAAVTFQVAYDGATYNNMWLQTAEFSATTAASVTNLWSHDLLGPIRSVKVRSGTAGVPVNQTADRIVTLICSKIFVG